MRKFMASTLDKMVGETIDQDGMLQWWVEQKGATVAAWLVWTHRERFLMTGIVEFRIPIGKPTPAWFRVAFEKLRQGKERWHCAVTHGPVHRLYTVRWLQRGTWSRVRSN